MDVERTEITVRSGKGDHDRLTMLPASALPGVERQIRRVRHLHDRDLGSGAGWVELPHAFGRKSPEAGHSWP